MKATKGDWTKVTGGDCGVVFDGYKWRWFQCLTCVNASGLLIPAQRRQLADMGKIVDRCQRNREDWIPCDGVKVHREYVARTGHL